MKLSTRGRYGTRVLLNLALHWGEGRVQLKDIAESEQISLPYLEQIIGPLVVAGLVRSTRGTHGGVRLAKAPGAIRLSEVIRLLEGSTALVDCLDDPKLCPRFEFCITREVWSEMEAAMNGVLESTTLQDLVERQKRKGRPAMGMYYI
jgi:Rrf2 family cysteine metabolism transcriptional repressor